MPAYKNGAPDILPEEFAAIFAMGENFYTQGQYKKAQIIFHGLMALDPHNHLAIIAYGEALLIDGQSAKALNHFHNASKRFPASFRIVLGAAKACLMLDRQSEAQEWLKPILTGEVKVTPEISRQIAGLVARLRKPA